MIARKFNRGRIDRLSIGRSKRKEADVHTDQTWKTCCHRWKVIERFNGLTLPEIFPKQDGPSDSRSPLRHGPSSPGDALTGKRRVQDND
jgi:hypothetical protein